ncbi:fibrinogen-binding adhesin SdrG C-terminal domain-containing protein, partial [Staphylococcus simulans]|uniref:SdrD B-like domain-containing protein n=1 Tax=Staphylococcus simulans TaxID=1286 RepID=UPI001E399A33
MGNNSRKNSFDARRQNKYSIRRFTVGTASIIVGATILFGLGNEARAAESSTSSSTTSSSDQTSGSTTPESTDQSVGTSSNSTDQSVGGNTESPSPTAEQTQTATEPANSVEAPASTDTVQPTQDATTKDSNVTSTTEAPTADTSSPDTASEPAPAPDTSSTTEKASEPAPTGDTSAADKVSEPVPTSDTSSTTEKASEPTPTEAPAPSSKTETTSGSTSEPTPTSTTEPTSSTAKEPTAEPTNSVITASEPTEQVTAASSNTTGTTNTDTSTSSTLAEQAGVTSTDSPEIATYKLLQQSSDNKDANTIQTTAETTPTLRTFSTFAAPTTTTLAAATGTNVNSLVTISNAQISETTIDPNQSGNFRLTADYTVNGDVKAGDYFTIQLPDYANMNGDFDYSGSNNQMQTELYSPAGLVVADGVYDTQTKTLTYTFTDFVNGKDHIAGSFDLAQFTDRENAPYSGTYALNYDLAGEAYNTQITYAYDTHNNISYPASIGTMITEVDATNTTNTFKQVIYVNPTDENLSSAFLTIAPKDANSSAVINYNDTQLHIYKVNDPNALTDSYAFDPTVYQDLAQNFYNNGSIYTNNDGLLEINFGQIDSPYVVVMETPFDPTYSDEITTRDTFYATDYAGKSSSYYYDNVVVKETSGGTGDGTVESYRLGDYVWNDTNHDGIQDIGETPIEGVTVTLKDTNGTVLQTAVTDMYGNYLFTDLANGDYVVEFTAPEGYVSTTRDAGTDNAKDSDGLVVPVTINGADDLTVDSGFYVPVPATYNLGDYVWEDSNKDGIQNSNEVGIEGVTVTLTKPDGTTATTVTDATGKYNFAGLENGEYTVTFTPPAGYEASPVNVGDAALDSNGLTTTATINNADNTTIDSGFFKPTVEPTPVPATY